MNIYKSCCTHSSTVKPLTQENKIDEFDEFITNAIQYKIKAILKMNKWVVFKKVVVNISFTKSSPKQ